MAKFEVGDRVRVTVESPPYIKGLWGAAKGEVGVVTAWYPKFNSYSVLLDNDPVQLPAAYSKDELEAES